MNNITIMIKPASSLCNMRCRYCFYANETSLREVPCYGLMSIKTLEQVVKKTLDACEFQCTFAFQGGEPTIAGLDFFEQVVAFQEKYNRKRIHISNTIQTNGYNINENWAKFFSNHHFLVGVSLDGPKDIHDYYRKGASGEGTYGKVLATIRLLEKYNVDFNILTVLTGTGSKKIGRIYGFFKKNGWKYQQYIPCLNPLQDLGGTYDFSLSSEEMGDCLCRLFDIWYRDAMSNHMQYNRFFNNLLTMVNGQPPESCNMVGRCSKQYVIEADGSVYPCDFYAIDKYRLGNLNTDTFAELDAQRETIQFIEKTQTVPEACQKCKWYFLCRNGCRRDREEMPDGTLGINRYCCAYQAFFAYAAPRLPRLLHKICAGQVAYIG